MREAIAHAATPWEWRSRAWVIALVVFAYALPVACIAKSWADVDGTGRLMALLLYGGLGSLLTIRPAHRSLKRWDDAHRAPGRAS